MNTIVQAIMHDQMCDFMLRYSDFKQYTKKYSHKVLFRKEKTGSIHIIIVNEAKSKNN